MTGVVARQGGVLGARDRAPSRRWKLHLRARVAQEQQELTGMAILAVLPIPGFPGTARVHYPALYYPARYTLRPCTTAAAIIPLITDWSGVPFWQASRSRTWSSGWANIPARGGQREARG